MLIIADQPPPPAPPIVVIGTRLPDPASERAYSVETIDREEIARSPSVELEQILRGSAGLQLFRRSDSRSGHPTSQGVTLRALGGNASSRALLILDGVPQSDPFGGWVNWPAYDPASLASVRIVRGGGSVAHGAGALAGTIEMTSDATPAVRGSAQVGSRNSSETSLYAGVPLGGTFLSLSGGFGQGDGFIPIVEEDRGPADRPAPYRDLNLRARWVAPLGGATELQLGLAGFSDKRERGVRFTENDTDGADASVRLVGTGPWAWSALAYGQWRELSSSFASVDDERTSAARVALQDSVPSTGFGAAFELRPPAGDDLELRLGADARLTDGESRELYSFSDGEPTRRRRAGGRAGSLGLFGEATARLGDLSLSGGARLDRWHIADGELVERPIATDEGLRDEQYENRSGWRPTARAGAVLDIKDGWSVRSAAYLGWRLPTLNELFRPFRAGADATAANPLLDPERLAGAEIGAQFDRPGLHLSATGYVNRLRDAIANVTIARGPGVFPGVGFVSAAGEYRQRQNLDAIHVRGIELSGEASRGPWSVRLGYSFADARVEADSVAAALDGLRPAQTPRHSLTAGLGWVQRDHALNLVVRRAGARFEDDLNLLRLPPATTIDAFAATPLTDRLQVVLRAENLLNARVLAGLDGDGVGERATPRTLWIGLRFRTDSLR